MEPSPVLTIQGLSKTFPGTLALDRVDFDVRPGEIHALIGQNGCGKSTLIKVLAGYHQPDPGSEIRLAGQPVELPDATASRDVGLRFVHQDLGLVETLSAVENLTLGRELETAFGGRIRWGYERRDAERRLRALGYELDVRRPVAELSPAERTGIAIARALWDWEEARVLVVDEPTAALPREEVKMLFEALRRVRDKGLGVVYVSHRLDEIFTIGDRVTILRDGQLVGTWDVADVTQDQLVSRMVGGEELRPPDAHRYGGRADVGLAVRALRGLEVDNINLEARRGEVVGIAGLTGSGREELLPLLFGAVSRGGTVQVAGEVVGPGPRGAMAAGMALVPADRRGDGAIVDLSVRDNCTLTDLRRHARRSGRLDRDAERAEVATWIERLDVRPRRADVTFGTLSGGNQQKVVLAKWLRREPSVLLLDEPTQGVDVHAKATIHGLARDVAAGGAVVVIASSDDRELCDTCDRVLVMRDGTIVAEVEGDRLTLEELGRLQLDVAPA